MRPPHELASQRPATDAAGLTPKYRDVRSLRKAARIHKRGLYTTGLTVSVRHFQEFKCLPIGDRGDAALGHGLDQSDPAIVAGIAEATAEHWIAKAEHQREAVVLDEIAERIVGYAE